LKKQNAKEEKKKQPGKKGRKLTELNKYTEDSMVKIAKWKK
jgi:hypothetical protein